VYNKGSRFVRANNRTGFFPGPKLGCAPCSGVCRRRKLLSGVFSYSHLKARHQNALLMQNVQAGLTLLSAALTTKKIYTTRNRPSSRLSSSATRRIKRLRTRTARPSSKLNTSRKRRKRARGDQAPRRTSYAQGTSCHLHLGENSAERLRYTSQSPNPWRTQSCLRRHNSRNEFKGQMLRRQ